MKHLPNGTEVAESIGNVRQMARREHRSREGRMLADGLFEGYSTLIVWPSIFVVLAVLLYLLNRGRE